VVNDGLVSSLPSTVNVIVLNVIKVGVSALESPIYKIYPNPTTGIINLEFTEGTSREAVVLVTNLVGVDVFRKEITDISKLRIDLSNQVSGIYFLKTIIGNQQYINKIVYRKE
jgi:fructose 1,6-bisphosphatase